MGNHRRNVISEVRKDNKQRILEYSQKGQKSGNGDQAELGMHHPGIYVSFAIDNR